jgi:hypothetical protein
MPRFLQTEYFRHTRQRPDRIGIREEWNEHVIEHPEHQEIQSDGRIRRWARISDIENRALRVILLEDGQTVRNAFFERDYKDK